MEMEQLAAQLRKPEGEAGKKVGELMNTSNALMNQWTIEALQLVPNDVVLEIGMGNGAFVKDILAAHPSIKYEGCDYSPLMVEEAFLRNREAIHSQRVAFHIATADQLPFADASFTKVFGVNVLYFWEQPLKELAEINRVLKPGGVLVLTIRTKDTMDLLPFTNIGFVKYNKEELKTLIENAGYIIESLEQKTEPEQTWNDLKVQPEDIVARCIKQ